MARKCVRFGRTRGKKVCREFSGTKRKGRKSKSSSSSSRSCVVKSGPKKGKLKKGYRFGKGGRCVKAK